MEVAPSASGEKALDPLAEAALDTVVGMLRAFGRHAFEITGADLGASASAAKPGPSILRTAPRTRYAGR